MFANYLRGTINKSKVICTKQQNELLEKTLLMQRLMKNEEKDKSYIALQQEEISRMKAYFDSILKSNTKQAKTKEGELVIIIQLRK